MYRMIKKDFLDENTKLKKVSLSVDSLFRDNYARTKSTDYTLNLPSSIHNVLNMKISAVEIPNFVYMFSSAKRETEFKITVYNYKIRNDTTTEIVNSTEYPIIIPEGNYLNVDFVNMINAYFLDRGGGLNYMILEIDVNSGKTIFRARHPIDDKSLPSPFDPSTPFYSPTFYFSLDFRIPDVERPIYRNLGWILGFKKEFYLVTPDKKLSTFFIPNSLDVINNNEIIFFAYCKSEGTYGNTLDNYIFLDIEDNNKNYSSDEIKTYLPGKYLKGDNILARITIDSTANSINFTSAADYITKTREYHGPVTISALKIKLFDKHGEILELNGNDFSFLIEFTTIDF
jgi:hypothetical protein